MKTAQAGTNIVWVDFIRVIATFFVIGLHSAAPLLIGYNDIPVNYWWVGNFFSSIARTGVPLFFMLSGYLLIGKSEPLWVFYRKRIVKVVVPLVVWSILYVFWNVYYLKAAPISLSSFYTGFLTPTSYHLWFLYAIIGVYLYVPILRVFIANADKIHLYYFISLWFVAASLIPLVEEVTGIKSLIDLKMISGFVGYFLIGRLAGQARIHGKLIMWSLVCFVASWATTALGTFVIAYYSGKPSGVLYHYYSPNIIFLSVSTFILLRVLFDNI